MAEETRSPETLLSEIAARVERGGAAKYHQKNAEQKKLFARERIRLLLDPGSFVEDGKLANSADPEFPADGVITGVGKVEGRSVCVIANDSTIKAGSWGKLTVEKMLRAQEFAAARRFPIFYLIDSAGARITDQVEMFPGRRGAGHIFYNQAHLSGVVPQICILFGPSAAGGAYVPAFCDVVFMIEGNASMYLGSPRMAEMVIGEKVSLDELGGARMHCTTSGCADFLCASEEEAIAQAKRYFSFVPDYCGKLPPSAPPSAPPEMSVGARLADLIPSDQNRPFDMAALIRGLVDANSFLEIKALFAGELITGFARIDGHVVGLVANQPKVKGGILFIDSADKAARFIWLCDAFHIPLLYLADVPGFMIGTKVERAGIIRAGAKMISAVAEATVPRISVVVRKAYGAGLYAMGGPGFAPSCTLALPQAMIAVMGPEAAVNAVYYNKIQEKPEAERPDYVAALREEYRADIDIFHLASELVLDAVVAADDLRSELIQRFAYYRQGYTPGSERKRAILPM